MKKIILSLAFILFASIAHAQTTASLQWNQTEAPGVAMGFSYTLKTDALPAVVLQPNCTLVNAVTTCTAAITGYVPGVHTMIITAANANGQASTTFSTNGNVPSAPGSPKIFVIIG